MADVEHPDKMTAPGLAAPYRPWPADRVTIGAPDIVGKVMGAAGKGSQRVFLTALQQQNGTWPFPGKPGRHDRTTESTANDDSFILTFLVHLSSLLPAFLGPNIVWNAAMLFYF
jgi:hypothetical protein